MELTNDTDGDLEDANMALSPADAAMDGGGGGVGSSSQEPASKKPVRGSQLSNLSREDSVDMVSELDSNPVSTTAQSASSVSSATPASGTSEHELPQGDSPPSLEQQVTIIRELSQVPLTEGMVGYVISNQWLQDAQERVEGSAKASSSPLPPIDLRELIITPPFANQLVNELGEIFYPLKPGLTVGEDIEVLPSSAWDKIIKWHGLKEGSPMVRRFCHNTSSNPTTENLSFEMYPPIFSIMKLPDTSAGLSAEILHDRELQAPKKAVSRSESYIKVLKEMKEAANIPESEDVRMWRVLNSVGDGTQQIGVMTPAQSRSNSPAPNTFEANLGDKLVLDVNKFLTLQEGSQRERIELPDTVNKPSSTRFTIDEAGLGQEGTLILEQRIGGPAGGEWVSDSAANKASKLGIKLPSGKTKSAVNSGRTSPIPGIQTRGRAQRQGRARGTVGLTNLGNTCYMNSALQCVKSVKELTNYFLDGKYSRELNPSNPLAHNGEVAKAYADLVKQLFAANGSAFSPRQFKSVIGRYGPSFSGYGQQDSQEFLLFLLDGLQEDLNRIHKKPYIEKPDSTDEMVHDEAALKQFADRCWEIYKARNDSVITDLFAGMYKSTVKCPVCDKVSIIFDPFNNLTLQLPIENAFTRAITFYPLNLPAVDIDVDIDKNATFAQLKEYIGRKVSVDPKKLVLSEVYKARFFKMYNDRQSISEDRIQGSDQICCFELEEAPTNYPPVKNQNRSLNMLEFYNHNDDDDEDSESPESDQLREMRMLVPIFHRAPKEQAYTKKTQLEGFAEPSYIILSYNESKDEEAILKKILAKVATMTTKDILDQGDESDGQGSDTVLLNREDAEASADSKIQTQSLQSEEGIVDVSMESTEDATAPRISYPPPPRLKKSLPLMLDSNQPIPSQYKNLFQLKYCHDGAGGSITTGWTGVGDGKSLPTLASRMPKPPKVAKSQTQNLGAKLKRRIKNGGSGGESSDEDSDAALPVAAAPSMHSSTASEEDEPIPVEQLSAAAEDKAEETGPRLAKSTKPLVKSGEGIVCDWNSDAYNALFSGNTVEEEDDFRGSPTWTTKHLALPDPEVDRKRRIRNARKRDGVSLNDCLEEFGKEEILSENDAWYCPRCKEHRRASKKFELWKCPDVLVIHLKRFSAQGRLRDKLDVTVDFPTDGLDLSSRVAVHDGGKELIYDLFAVDNHYGGLGGGHYTAYARSFVDGDWYEYNDSIASRVNASQTVTRAAYLLFYRRRTSQPLGGPFFENLQSKDEGNEAESASSPASRTQSPSQAGEGQRLDVFSRNGSSSAYQEAGATHLAGGGGHQGRNTRSSMTDLEDDLPTYSDDFVRSSDGMDLDEPSQGGGHAGAVVTWNGFGTLGASDNDDDDRSTGVSSTGAIHDDQDSIRSNATDNGFAPGTPVDAMHILSDVHELPEVNISATSIGDPDDDDLADPQVAEVRLEEDDSKAKSD